MSLDADRGYLRQHSGRTLWVCMHTQAENRHQSSLVVSAIPSRSSQGRYFAWAVTGYQLWTAYGERGRDAGENLQIPSLPSEACQYFLMFFEDLEASESNGLA